MMDNALQTKEQPRRACKRIIDKDAETSSKKRVMRKPGLSNPPNITKKHLNALISCLNSNNEPYAQNDWRMQPWQPRPYEVLPGYKIADDFDMSLEESKIIKEDLHTDLEGDTVITPEMLNMPTTTKVRLAKMPIALEPGKDIEEHCSWGIDCFTRRGLMDALALCPELMSTANSDDAQGSSIRSIFVDKEILPALNSLRDEGWDLFRAARKIAENAKEIGDYVKLATANRLLQLMQRSEQHHLKSIGACARVNKLPPHERVYFRAHPKGEGVFCVVPEGIAPGTFVGEYLGEIYSPWRWFERQDIFKKRNPDSSLPDFYNIQLERPIEDCDGYGVLFVEGASKGNFVSRLCHSCRPNCRMMSVCAENRITNALFTLRHISEGEELCWDYSCVTESEKEYRAATCLCGSADCRGSFLYYANSSSFQQILSRDHNFLDRNAILLRAGLEKLTESDFEKLSKYGIKRHALRANCDGDKLVPAWLIKWAALILEFMLHEREVLPAALVAKASSNPELQLKYSEGNNLAAIDAQGVFMNRLQNLLITLDKAKYFLRKQPSENQHVPLRLLSHDEVLQHLRSVIDGVRNAIHKHMVLMENKERGDSIASDQYSVLQRVDRIIHCFSPSSVPEALDGLRRIANILAAAGSEHALMHDGLLLRASTQYWFTPNKYMCVTSNPVQVPEPDDKMSQASVSSAQADMNTADGNNSSVLGAKHHSEEASCQRTMKPIKTKKYSSSFLWGQLLTWYKQTIYNPAASLIADRRGTLLLPALGKCYNNAALDGTYVTKVRPHMINTIEKKPDSPWPSGETWSYCSTTGVFGSPMLDQAMLRTIGKPKPALVQGLLETLKQTYDGNSGCHSNKTGRQGS